MRRQNKKSRQDDELAQGKIKKHKEEGWKLLIKERNLLDQLQEQSRKLRQKDQQQLEHQQG